MVNMKFAFVALLLALLNTGTPSVQSLLNEDVLGARLQKSVMNYILQSTASTEASDTAVVSSECFSEYLPLLYEVANAYSVQYQACVQLTNMQIANLSEEAQAQRTALIAVTTSMCGAFEGCGNQTLDDQAALDCYASVSALNYVRVYDLSNSATSASNTLTFGLQTVQQDQEQCMNETQRRYVANTAATYTLLDQCLQSGTTIAVDTTTVASTRAMTSLPTVGQPEDVEEMLSVKNETDQCDQGARTGTGCQSHSSEGESHNQSTAGE